MNENETRSENGTQMLVRSSFSQTPLWGMTNVKENWYQPEVMEWR